MFVEEDGRNGAFHIALRPAPRPGILALEHKVQIFDFRPPGLLESNNV